MSHLSIATEGLGKAYRARGTRDAYWALRGVTLQIATGESVGIIGRNGAGKSTLLRSICGTLRPTEGRVLTAGRVVGLLELGTGFNPEFTGLENARLLAGVLGLSQEETEMRLPAIEAFADLADFINRPVREYSSGMYARLAFSVAVHVDADVLVVDEILSVGDTAFTQKCMRWLRAFAQKGTLVFSSHDLSAVINLCDRVIWIDDGSIKGIGPAKEMCKDYLRIMRGAQGESGSVHPEQHPHMSRIGESKIVPIPNTTVTFGPFESGAAWYGKHEFSVMHATVLDENHAAASRFHIGDSVVLVVDVAAHADSDALIVGFLVTDNSGYYIFGQNSLATGAGLSVARGERVRVTFGFHVPQLHPGRYFVLLGISEGSQETFIEQHWIERAIHLEVRAPRLPAGIMNLPHVNRRVAQATEPNRTS